MTSNTINISCAINGRLDPHQFHHERVDMINNICLSGDWCRLKNVVKNVKTITTSLSADDIYIGLENIVSDSGDYVPTSNKDTISSAAIFKKGDILFPKLRPYLNKVHRAEFAGKCSTEFHVLEAVGINPDFLTIILRSKMVLAQTKHLMTGNTLPRLQTYDVENIIIPLPPIETQQQIVDIYTTAQKTKQAKEEQANTLLDSIDDYLLSQLGIILPTKDNSHIEDANYKIKLSGLLGKRYDPYYHNPYFYTAFQELNKSKFHLQSLGEISTLITSGMTPKSGGDAYTNAENGVAFIRSGDIDISGEIDFDNLLYIKHEVHNTTMKSSHVKDNDIMIAIVGATIGQVGIYHSNKEANINQAIALVRLKDGYMPEYIKEVIKSSIGQLNLDRLKRPVARANINLEEISSMLIPVPETETQNEIVKNIVSIREQAKQLLKKGVELLEQTKKDIEKIILD